MRIVTIITQNALGAWDTADGANVSCGGYQTLRCENARSIDDFVGLIKREYNMDDDEPFAQSDSVVIINCGAGHEDLTDEYAAIPREMQSVCRLFGKQVLAEIPEEEFFSRLREVRAVAGDRAALRAVHIYQENRRVLQMRQALQEDRFADYLALVNASGLSSWRYLQNVCPAGAKAEQPMAITLALCERLLGGHGACRVHGGGFAGTVQAYVPTELAADFKQRIESFLAPDCCQIRKVRPIGVCELALV